MLLRSFSGRDPDLSEVNIPMRIKELLIEGYPEARAKYEKEGIDPHTLSTTLQNFRSLVDRNQLQGTEKNIDWWAKNYSFLDFFKFVQEKLSTPSKTQIKKGKVAGKSILLSEDEEWLIVIPLDFNASCFYGKKTAWCTAVKPSYFRSHFSYHNSTLVYCINKQTGNKWAIQIFPDKVQGTIIWNAADQKITPDQFQSETGLIIDQIISKALDHSNQIVNARKKSLADKKKLPELYDKFKETEPKVPSPALEKLFLNLFDDDWEHTYLNSYILTLAKSGYSLENINPEVLRMAAKNDWKKIKLIKRPPQEMLEGAVTSRYRADALEYIARRMKRRINDRILSLYLNTDNTYWFNGLVRELRYNKITVSQSVINKACKHNPLYAKVFLYYGYPVPKSLQPVETNNENT